MIFNFVTVWLFKYTALKPPQTVGAADTYVHLCGNVWTVSGMRYDFLASFILTHSVLFKKAFTQRREKLHCLGGPLRRIGAWWVMLTEEVMDHGEGNIRDAGGVFFTLVELVVETKKHI